MTSITRAIITTFSGIEFDLLNPTPNMIDVVDIAHHLSQVCRWAGAPTCFWSVAQHSVMVSMIVPEELQLWGLLHDAAEAYIGDITRPLKNLLPEIREIETRIMRVIANRFNLEWPEPSALSTYDDQCIRYEAETIMRWHGGQFAGRGKDFTHIDAMTPEQLRRLPAHILRPMNPNSAEVLFALRFQELFPDVVLFI